MKNYRHYTSKQIRELMIYKTPCEILQGIERWIRLQLSKQGIKVHKNQGTVSIKILTNVSMDQEQETSHVFGWKIEKRVVKIAFINCIYNFNI